ncbi:DedD protein [Franzmannia pantelleriensis]|uniref:DedD protein n=1 Tax=Franzmannia pantelleriensis TaxID=48727 RepID=A0A1G9VPW2_9GAMM|nr:SPOR domain-containing protein [Halomonas pantelleriensis]SDM74229.1 DedD protein [Halomonas pantelleriensis]
MKYGMRERISGAVIIIALGVIFVPMLFDSPAPREERPAPVLTIEQPIDVQRTPVDEPTPPASLSTPPAGEIEEPPEVDAEQVVEATEPVERDEPGDLDQPTPAAPEASDPIAELAESAQAPSEPEPEAAAEPEQTPPTAPSEGGEWEVQVGSFGQPDNAERLEAQLNEQGFSAYRRARDNDMTSVYVGPFASSSDGEQARTELQERANIQGLLVRVRED